MSTTYEEFMRTSAEITEEYRRWMNLPAEQSAPRSTPQSKWANATGGPQTRVTSTAEDVGRATSFGRAMNGFADAVKDDIKFVTNRINVPSPAKATESFAERMKAARAKAKAEKESAKKRSQTPADDDGDDDDDVDDDD